MTERFRNEPQETEDQKAVREGKQSPNWQQYHDLPLDIAPEKEAELRQDAPYTEGFPRTPRAYNGGLYELITVNGSRSIARVDFTTQAQAQGIEWQRVEGRYSNPDYVLAWREYTPPAKKQAPSPQRPSQR
jgi:hypothetical protein